MRVLVWNLFHGRAGPRAGRPLLHEFAETLAGWEWDVALLQEVPPWWPPLLAGRCRADVRTALTSRNQLLPLRRAIASRRPDLLRSNGGGANAILVRAPWTITAHGRRRLRIRPERRVVHAVRIERSPGLPAASSATGGDRGRVVGGPGRDRGRDIGGPSGDRGRVVGGSGRTADRTLDGAWVGNVHAQLGSWDDEDGMAAPLSDLFRATAQLEAWGRTVPPPAGQGAATTVFPAGATTAASPGHPTTAASADGPTVTTSPAGPAAPRPGAGAVPRTPLILGGDLNLPRDVVAASLPAGWTRIASSGPDHVVGLRTTAAGPSRRLHRGLLSDHAPLLVEVRALRSDLRG